MTRAYEATVGEVQRAYDLTIQAADTAQGTASALARIQQILDDFPQERFVRGALAKANGLSGNFSVKETVSQASEPLTGESHGEGGCVDQVAAEAMKPNLVRALIQRGALR